MQSFCTILLQGGNINGSDAPLASRVNKITWSRYVTLDSLVSRPVLAWRASDALMLPLVSSYAGAAGKRTRYSLTFSGLARRPSGIELATPQKHSVCAKTTPISPQTLRRRFRGG